MQPDADWPSDINIDASAIDEEQEGGDMSVVFQPQQQREVSLTEQNKRENISFLGAPAVPLQR